MNAGARPGGARPGAGARAGAGRPGGNRTPGFSRPGGVGGANRLSGGARPGAGNRQNIGGRGGVGNRGGVANRPNVGGPGGIGGRPNVGGRGGVGGRTDLGSRGGIGGRPNIGGPGGVGGVGGIGGRPNIGGPGGVGGIGGRPNIGGPGGVGGIGGRPNIGGPGGVGGIGGRTDIGGRGGIGGRQGLGDRGLGASTLPSTRPDIGGRPGIGNRPGIDNRPGIGGRPGISTLPALGAGAAGAAIGGALGSRFGDRSTASLPGLGDNRLANSQLPANGSLQDRRDALQNRLGGDGQRRQDWQQNSADRQQNREQRRGDFQQNSGDRQENRQERREGYQQNSENRQENRQQRRDDWQQNWDQRRNDWQQNCNDICDNWQDYRDQARDDWQGWFDDHYGGYGGWYSGYAPGYWDQSDYLWNQYPVAAAAGLTWWGANSLGYGFGCSDYYNPYYTDSMPACYTEPIVSVPIEVTQETSTAVPTQAVASPTVPATPPQAGSPPVSAAAPASPPDATSAAATQFDQARAAFLEGQYDVALKLTDDAIKQMPRDAVLHEFRSLVLFALGRYAESAATVHPVLDVGPGWDWKTLSGLYANIDVYTQQLRSLESARDKDPKAADLRFLLGYHYLTCGHTDQALTEFRQAHELQPNDAVAAALVATLSPRAAQQAQPPQAEAPKAIQPDSVLGNWKAQGKGSANYSLNLNKDGSFAWGFTRDARKQEVKGVQTLEGNVLAMEPDSGGVLLAELTLKDPNTLHFKMIGGASNDPGLDFQRATR
jgi:tetratricopeptide (TPR) repeat protein